MEMVDWLNDIDFGNIDLFMKEQGFGKSFYELVVEIIEQGWNVESIKDLVIWIKNALVLELQTNKALFLEVILITFCFSLLKNTFGTFSSTYMSEVSFLLVYSMLAVLLIRSIYLLQVIVFETVGKSVEFMRVFVPCFCTGMIFSSNLNSSVGFYGMAFILIYLVEWIMGEVLLPLIHIYILLQICSHLFKETTFLNLAELFSRIVNWGLKIAITAVFGLSVVQNLIHPVKDRMTMGGFVKGLSFLPGVGNISNGVGEVFLGAGMMIKNAIGMAGIVALLLIGIGPLVKTACIAFSYQLLAAFTEPLSDTRITECVKGLSNGAILYLKVMSYSLLLFFIVIALTVGATSFVY